jgi:cell division protein FtsZ
MNLQTQIKNNNMFFDIQPEDESLIKVIGVGGGGNNAVNFMYKQGIEGVNFIICNTDQQSLANSEVPNKIQLGPSLTGGRGAGAKPEVGKEATIESEEEIRKAIGHNTQMVFVTAGMGGGTGTGGAPIVAKIAKDMGILTVGIVTVPFSFEGKSKRDKANAGLAELSQHVDSLIVISNNKLREIYGNLSLTAAFSHADNILTTAARGISEIITKPGLVNVDFEDVKTVMMNSGVAIMGVGVAEGEGRATKAIDAALASPLLDENDIYGSRGILLYISSGAKEVTMDEVSQITDYVQQAANNDTEIIWGVCHDDSLEDEVSVTLIATGFKNNETRPAPAKEKVVVTIDQLNQKVAEVTQPIVLAHKNDEVIKVELKTVEPTFEVEFKTDEPKVTISTEPVFTIRHIENKETNNSQSVPASNPVNEKTNDRADVNKEFLKRRLGSNRFNDPKYIQEMEKTPSFERKNRKFDNIPHSSQSHLSRYTIVDNYENENGNSLELKKNSFLSDKPD